MGVSGGGVTGYTLYFCLLFIKTEKVQEHDLYLNQIIHQFDFKNVFLGWIIKILRKGGPRSIVVLIDFKAILLTPGIFLIQIVNTNVYLIHFYSKNNIKMHFPKSWVIKIPNRFRHSLSIATP